MNRMVTKQLYSVVLNNYLIGSFFKCTCTHDVVKKERLTPYKTLVVYELEHDYEVKEIERLLHMKLHKVDSI